ncbi:MAG: hypothetical protein ACLVB4_03635 [Butyricicoccus sp.]
MQWIFFRPYWKTTCLSHFSWGRALEALCDVLEPTDYSDYYNVTVVQMVGCLGTGNPRVDGLELALRLSKRCTAPIPTSMRRSM